MVIIGMDISLSSTAITILINDEEYIFCYLSKDKTSKWANILEGEHNINIKRVDKQVKSDNYSTNEILKLKKYDYLSDLILKDLKSIVNDMRCDIRIEGYSYTKNTNSIIDIIGLSTLIRIKLLKELNCEISIISPSTLKLNTCKLCYKEVEIKRYHKKNGKELKPIIKNINLDGIPGGKFTKFEIYKSIIEGGIKSIMVKFLKNYKDDIFCMKKIPSPIDDINDSIMLSKINI